MFKAASTSDFATWQDRWRFNQEECWTQSIAKTQADEVQQVANFKQHGSRSKKINS